MPDSLSRKIAFSQAKGMSGSAAVEMLRRVGGVDLFFDLSSAQLRTMAAVESGIFADSYRQALLSNAENEATFVTHNNIRARFITDVDYPRRLRDCDDAPTMLYSLGSCDLDAPHTIGIVGTRHATPYGIDFTTRLVSELAEAVPGLVVVSGLAFGIDVAAHKAALAAGLPTVAVLAHGLNTIYPAEHRSVAVKMVEQGGALVTEYTSADRIHRSSFLARNRIVAGLCDCLVVVESDYKGGSMATARIAMQYNREVLAVPGRVNDIYSRGTNRLIANNTAQILCSAADLIEIMQWQSQAAPSTQKSLFPTLSAEQEAVYQYIIDNPEATSNDICVNMGLTYAALSNVIFELEMADVIISLPGGRFAPTSLTR